jgi:hypothetical protein
MEQSRVNDQVRNHELPEGRNTIKPRTLQKLTKAIHGLQEQTWKD